VHRCDANVIIIDTGISKAYGGILSALEITYDLYETPAEAALELERDQKAVSISQYALAKTKFVEVETVHALYPKGRVQLDRREAVVHFDTTKPAVRP
jgi:hypothetical protein